MNVATKVVHKLKYHLSSSKSEKCKDGDPPKIWLTFIYIGKQGDELVQRYLRKIKRNPTKPTCIRIELKINKNSMIVSNKDYTPLDL